MITRILTKRISESKKSILLLGPRQVGKSTLVRSLSPQKVINLAREAEYLSYARDPDRLWRVITALPPTGTVVIDEVQRVPAMLNVVQALLDEGDGHRFILTGSSARKLRQRGVNLLPGRVLLEYLDPLLYWELPEEVSLQRLLRVGALPGVLLDPIHGADTLGTYTEVYLREEIRTEAAVRNVGDYARFLDTAAEASGAWINYSKVASDGELNKETVRRFFGLLDETLLTFRIEPYRAAQSMRRLSQRARFVFFDVGVRNAILGLHRRTPTATEYGALFEQWVILQCIGFSRAYKQGWRFSSYRTDAGAEVDLVIDLGERLLAVEVKYGTAVSERACSGLRSLAEVARKPIECYIVSRMAERQKFSRGEIALSYHEFFRQVLPACRTPTVR